MDAKWIKLFLLLLLLAIPQGSGIAQEDMKPASDAMRRIIEDSFSVISPVELKSVPTSFSGGMGGPYKSISFLTGKSGETQFFVYVMDLTKRKLSDKHFDDLVSGLEFVLGGDDDKQFVVSYKLVDSLRGKEIVYSDQNIRGLIVNGQSKIYVLGIETKDRTDLNSETANRFFSSFRLLRNRK